MCLAEKQVITSNLKSLPKQRLCNKALFMCDVAELTYSASNQLFEFKTNFGRLDSLIKAHDHTLKIQSQGSWACDCVALTPEYPAKFNE